MKNTECYYDVLDPWAEVSPIPLRGISPRITDLTGKTVGLFCSVYKSASRPILDVIQERLKERFPTLKFSWFLFGLNLDITETEEHSKFKEWLKGVDAAIAAVGD